MVWVSNTYFGVRWQLVEWLKAITNNERKPHFVIFKQRDQEDESVLLLLPQVHLLNRNGKRSPTRLRMRLGSQLT